MCTICRTSALVLDTAVRCHSLMTRADGGPVLVCYHCGSEGVLVGTAPTPVGGIIYAPGIRRRRHTPRLWTWYPHSTPTARIPAWCPACLGKGPIELLMVADRLPRSSALPTRPWHWRHRTPPPASVPSRSVVAWVAYWSNRDPSVVAAAQVRECTRGQSATVHPWGFKPTPRFFVRSLQDRHRLVSRVDPIPGEATFGFELEVEWDEYPRGMGRIASTVVEHLGGAVYCKRDSSIFGVEIVSHPCTWRALRVVAAKVGDALAALDKTYRIRSHASGRCGLHVHIGRRSFADPFHLMRFLRLFYWHQEDAIRLSGRTKQQLDGFATFADVPDWDLDLRALLRKLYDGRCRDRRTAINLCPAETVEVRLFRGTVHPVLLLGALESCAAALTYTLTVPTPAWTDWTDWVADQPRQYPTLATHQLLSVPRDVIAAPHTH